MRYSLGRVFLASLLFLTISSHAIADSRPFKIGFIGPLSGSAASYGVASKNGIEMALHDLGPHSGIQVVYEDDRFQAKDTVSLLSRMIGEGGFDAFISIASGPSNAIAPIISEHGALLFAWASDPKVSLGHKTIVRTYPSGQDEGRRAGEEVVRRKYSKVAYISSADSYSQSVVEGVRSVLNHGELVFTEEVSPELRDFRTLLLRARVSKVDALGMCLAPGQVGLAALQARSIGITADIFGCESINSSDEVKGSNGALVNAWFVSTDSRPEFRARYIKEWGNDSVISGAAIHYDLIKMLSGVVKKHRSPDDLIGALNSLGRFGEALPGASFILSPNDRFLSVELLIRQVGKDGFR